MDQYVLFALLGLTSGALYAALGLGLVVTYRGVGAINFAAGAMGMWSAYVYSELETNGDTAPPEPAPKEVAVEVADASADSAEEAGYVPMSEWIEDFDRRA